MKTAPDPSRAPDAPSASKPPAGDDLKTMLLADLERELGCSTEGLGQAEATRRLATYGPRVRVRKMVR